MLGYLLRVLVIYTIVVLILVVAAFAEDRPTDRAIQEEVWAIPITLPTIAYVTDQKLILPDNVIVVGQSAGGWAAIALSSENLPGVRAIIAFAAGRGGRVGGKPNNNCAPDRLVAATGEFGRTARTPMLWIYVGNDTCFGPALSMRMHQAYTEAGGNAEYHLFLSFGSDGHFMIDSPDGIPLWTPLVESFLERHR